MPPAPPSLGCVLVCYNAGPALLDCLESLLATRGPRLCVVVVDNASTDDSVARLTAWAEGRTPYAAPADLPFPLAPVPKPLRFDAPGPGGHRLRLLRAAVNGGFAAGANLGLAALAAEPEIDRFWLLNPDAVVPPGTPGALAGFAPPGGFALMGGRALYLEAPERIQIDGGLIDWRSGQTRNLNQCAPHDAPWPDPARLDFVTGASLVASRAFYEAAGPLPEDYFLYYEEVEWALRRGALPLAYCPGAVIYHRAGAAIGSGAPGRPASAFSLYFLHRGRMRFLRRHRPAALPYAAVWTLAKAAQLLLRRRPAAAAATLRAGCGLGPPSAVRARLAPAAQARAFARFRP